MRGDMGSLRLSLASGRLDEAGLPCSTRVSMKSHIVHNCVVIAALILAGGAWAQAQAPSVQIGFKFVAAGKTFDAGSYSVDIASTGNVVLTPENGGAAVEIPQLKTLSHRNVQKLELRFDRVGSAMFLSEVWLPGKGGCLVGKVDNPEERVSVSGPKITK
jgi:hypothetical protein